MTFEDPASTFFNNNQYDSLSTQQEQDQQKQKRTFFSTLKEYNSHFAPAIAHMSFAGCCVMTGLYCDDIMKPRIWNTFPFFIFGIILLLFPLLFTIQRKIEANIWKPKDFWCYSCCTDPKDDELLLSLDGSSADLDESNKYLSQPNRLYEKVYKFLAFQDSLRADDELITNPSISFITLHIWLGYVFITAWAKITFNLTPKPLLIALPGYILLSISIAFIWKKGNIWFSIPSIIFLLTNIFYHIYSRQIESHSLSVLSIPSPLLFFPACTIIGSLLIFVFTNSRILGITALILSSLFTLWSITALLYILRWSESTPGLKFLDSIPVSVAMIPIYLLLCTSFLTLYIKLAQ